MSHGTDSSVDRAAQTVMTRAFTDAQRGVTAEAFAVGRRRALSSWRSSVASIVIAATFLAGIIVFGTQTLDGAATCGGEVMQPGDSCVNLDTGSTSSAADVGGAVANQPWFWTLLGLGVGAILVFLLVRRFVPSASHRKSMRVTIERERRGLADAEQIGRAHV